jgi:hypothetical protein
MRNRLRKDKGSGESIVATVDAVNLGDIPSSPDGKNPFAVALGRLGGLKGGPARAAKLTAKQRSDSAKKAARSRWAK